MASRYTQSVKSSETHFTRAPLGELEFSKMRARPRETTTFNAGEIVPIFCQEVLPHDTFKVDMDFVIRQATVAVPTMDSLVVDFYAFFVPNRVVNKSWKNVMGENSSGAWAQENVITLAPLVSTPPSTTSSVQVPVGSVADHYGYPTQGRIPDTLLAQCHDLKFRGYLEIYNNYFRDQNYQPPIPYSKLNVYEGFFIPGNVSIGLTRTDVTDYIPTGTPADGQVGAGAVVKEFVGDGGKLVNAGISIARGARRSMWSALGKPLKANKLHDYFTSVLPSPQKGRQVAVPLSGDVRLNTSSDSYVFANLKNGIAPVLNFTTALQNNSTLRILTDGVIKQDEDGNSFKEGAVVSYSVSGTATAPANLTGTNLVADLNQSQVSIPLEDIRMTAALQQVYEILGRGGSRYTEYINSFFGLDIDNPFDDIPSYLGHFRRELDLFQTAQTSATPEGSGTAQGNLAAFGYTNKSGDLFHYTFKEHGYIHIFCVVRQKNTYSSLLSRDNFRMNMMDFYQYPLANITEQPVYTREINPFTPEIDDVFGYQEAWCEYRMIPDRVSGYMRPGVNLSLANWNYADEFDSALRIADGEWLQSNAEEVVSRTTALQDTELPQFKGQFFFNIVMERPMPVYSVAGLDII